MAAYVLHCDAQDVQPEGQCAAPYYAPAETAIPALSFEDGVLIAGAIGGVWALGLIVRILVRTQQLATRNF